MSTIQHRPTNCTPTNHTTIAHYEHIISLLNYIVSLIPESDNIRINILTIHNCIGSPINGIHSKSKPQINKNDWFYLLQHHAMKLFHPQVQQLWLYHRDANIRML